MSVPTTTAIISADDIARHGDEPVYRHMLAAARRVRVIAFDSFDAILAVQDARGVDLPGGRINWDDDSHEAAALRDVIEQTGIHLGPLHLVAIVAVATRGNGPAAMDYTLVMAARVPESRPLSRVQKRRQIFLPVARFATHYKGALGELPRLLAMAAETVTAANAVSGTP